MSDVTLTVGTVTSDVARGDLMIPRSGFWTSDLLLGDNETAPRIGALCSLRAYDRDRVGAIEAIGEEYGQIKLRVVGGASLLNGTIEPRAYSDYPLSDIAFDIIADAGGVSGTLRGLDAIAPYWVRSRGPGIAALRRVLAAARTPGPGTDAVDVRLYTDDTGAVCTALWAPPVLTPAQAQQVASTYTTLVVWPQDREAYLGPDLNTSLEPGQTVTIYDRQVALTRCIYRFEASDLRCEIWWEELA